jgi:predicted phage terminase large subunit-like protein
MFSDFASESFSFVKPTPFHMSYYRILEHFARGDIRKLIVTVPPQHGKSLGASVVLPAYLLGLNPDLKVAVASYNATLASRFNRRVQRLMDSEAYARRFPETAIKSLSGKSEYARTSSHTEIIGHQGELHAVGREGSLTGHEVDIFILDDLYKDAMEANSPVVRENCWEWYTDVVKTRLHNDSQELIVFTRWHEEDLIGTILAKEKHTVLKSWGQIESLPADRWLVVNFEALKESAPTEADPRARGEALWPKKHSREHLLERRNLDAARFECLYQGKPSARGGRLYGDNFQTWDEVDEEVVRKGCYVDTADLGDDYLCAVCYDIGASGSVYVTDAVYSREGMEVTENLVAEMLTRNDTRIAHVESNNGGRGFARAVGRLAPRTKVEWFHQSGNKEARILTNSATVLHTIRLPTGWGARWPDMHRHLTLYNRRFDSNRWHDAADVLTGIIERETIRAGDKRIRIVTGK